MDTVRREVETRPIERYQAPWVAWPVAWNAIWVGALAARNSALGAITALLLGLIGSVIGGWLGSRKPMASYDDRAPSVTTGRPIV